MSDISYILTVLGGLTVFAAAFRLIYKAFSGQLFFKHAKKVVWVALSDDKFFYDIIGEKIDEKLAAKIDREPHDQDANERVRHLKDSYKELLQEFSDTIRKDSKEDRKRMLEEINNTIKMRLQEYEIKKLKENKN